MPLVEITLTEGRDPTTLRDLIHQVHRGVVTSLKADPQSVRVVVREVPRSLWAAGDQTLEERDAERDAERGAVAQEPSDQPRNGGS